MSASATSRARIDFTTLSSQLRILATSPAWPEVQRAIEKLEAARPTTSQDETEIGNYARWVREFGEMLRRSGDFLGDALAAGSIVGRASPVPTAGERLLVGLTALSQACRFDELSEQLLRDTLKTVREPLFARFLPGASATWKLPQLTNLESLQRWETEVETIRAQAEAVVRFQESDLRTIEEQAWVDWRRRVEVFLRGEPLVAATVDELLNFASSRTPGSLLKFALQRMTLGDWSEVLVQCQAPLPDQGDTIPSWLALVALHELGFRGPLTYWTRTWWAQRRRPADRSGGDLSVWYWLDSEHVSHKGILIVRRMQSSPVTSWTPSQSLPAFTVSADQLQRLASSTPGPKKATLIGADPTDPFQFLFRFLQQLGIDRVAVEMPQTEELVRLVRRTAKASKMPLLHVYPEAASPMEPPHSIGPKSLEDLARGFGDLRRGAGATP